MFIELIIDENNHHFNQYIRSEIRLPLSRWFDRLGTMASKAFELRLQHAERDLLDLKGRTTKLEGTIGALKRILLGEQQEVVYVDISRARMAELGISWNSIIRVLESPHTITVTRMADRFRLMPMIAPRLSSSDPVASARLNDW